MSIYKPFWTDARRIRAAEMYLTHSAAEVAVILHTSRCGVCGIWKRMGLKGKRELWRASLRGRNRKKEQRVGAQAV